MTTASSPIAHAPSGSFAGLDLEDVQAYRGISYAQAPVGKLRFCPPQPLAASSEQILATEPGPVSLQSPSRLSHVMGDDQSPGSEDCLRLSVWTPKADDQKRPVVIWLHGGAFMTGAGDLPWYDGVRLASEGDMVVVNVNYRLGALGFLCGPNVSPGNLGLMDQAMAVSWVKDNIAAFGGDPDQITLMGQSAGGLSIALLLCAYPELPVQRLIMMSAPLGLELSSTQVSTPMAAAYAHALDKQHLSLLGTLTAEQLLGAQGAAARFFMENLAKTGDVAPPFVPVADGSFLPYPSQLQASLAIAATRRDVMIGTTRDEATAFFARGSFDAMTQQVFETPSLLWASQAAQAQRVAYVYRFDHDPSGEALGATHCIELPFVFGNREAFATAPMLGGMEEEAFEALSRPVRQAFISFIREGRPSGNDLPLWPALPPDQPIPRLHFAKHIAVQELPPMR
ncbi:carboxylesterase family protein [Curvibacter sp. HBC28]|uniref:Carboxylic ester hydrolase n=1 Tax=Curvibacter microcysteis TaxID=3026419 RepID=A0ABT5M9F8_9BURK|nr:carboxylesterase family protein [Curvibacter sp. HBC28]MDD0813219.1 carboxylesterase family protein [Curvibacter sp. HBC28]